jgi:hypothetical protein
MERGTKTSKRMGKRNTRRLENENAGKRNHHQLHNRRNARGNEMKIRKIPEDSIWERIKTWESIHQNMNPKKRTRKMREIFKKELDFIDIFYPEKGVVREMEETKK